MSTSDNKRIAKNTLLLYVRTVFVLVISLYTSRLILDVLGINDYGIYQLVGGVVAMFSMLSSSMASASQRFITYALGRQNPQQLKGVFLTSFTLHVVIGVIMVLFLEVVGTYFLYHHLNIPPERLSAAVWVLQCSIIALFFNVISVPFNALIIAHERMNVFAYISILDVSLKLLCVYILYVSTFDKLITYSIAVIFASMIIQTIYMHYSRRNFQEASNISFYINNALFKEMSSFAGWNLWGSGSALLRNQGVDILINIFFGVALNAAKGVCNQVQNAIYQFVSNFQTAVNPQITKAVAQCDDERVNFLLFQGSRFSFYLLMIFAVPLMISCQYLLSLWLVEVPDYTLLFVNWIMVYLLLDTLSRFLIHSILSYGNIRNYQIVAGTLKLCVLPLAYVGFSLGMGPITGVWMNILIELICVLVRLRYAKKRFNISIFGYLLNVVLKCWFVFAIAIFVAYIGTLVVGVSLIQICLSVLSTLTIIYFLGITCDERKFLISKVQTIISRKL